MNSCAIEHLNFTKQCGNRFEVRWSICFASFGSSSKNAIVKELLKLDNIFPSYCQNKKGVIFMAYSIHRVRKKRVWSISDITSSNTGKFLKFFYCYNLQEICSKAIVKYPTTPQTRRYTTL